MFQSSTIVRVRYAETDRMKYVYYGNYPTYYEIGRVEALREIGMTYKSLEDSGIMMPVLELKVKYVKPAFYDEELLVITKIPTLPATRIQFEYEIFNSSEELINIGETTLVFVNTSNGKPRGAPEEMIEKLQAFFSAE